MFILMWLISAVTLLIVDRLLPGMHFSGLYSALVAAALLGLVNIIIRPILLLLTLPINLLTLGLFTFVINALMLLLVSSIVKGFEIDSFQTAIIAAILLWLISFISNAFMHATRQNER